MMRMIALLALWAATARSACPALESGDLPVCEGMTDYQLCRVAITPKFEDLPDSNFGATPLDCKTRAAGIREHVLYWGTKGDSECKKAAKLYLTCNTAHAEEACYLVGMSCTKQCKNDGMLLNPKLDNCTCACPKGFTGEECEVCNDECLHGGKVVQKGLDCWCACEYPWGGRQCDICQRNCKHGGHLNSFWEPTPTNYDARQCSCRCRKPWTGGDCEICGKECQNGGVLDAEKCECACPKCTRGSTCETCLRQCHNGGDLVREGCTCTCPAPWTGPDCQDCPVKCKNGGVLNKKDCTCECDGAWKGKTCETCDLKCFHRGALDAKGCKCRCRAPWTGPSCRVCPLICLNGGQVDKQKCSCKCKPCKNGAVPDATCGCPKKAVLVEQ